MRPLTVRIRLPRAGQGGFTIVEIAIVMLIVGLLVGGILKGQELISQARIKVIIADFSGVSAAYHGYFDRYRALPGDDPRAAQRWTTPTVATDGNGDGEVSGTYNNGNAPCVPTVESCNWWDHLRRGGFLAGSGPIPPANWSNGQIGVQTGDGAIPAGPVLGGPGGAGGITGLILCSGNLLDKIVSAIDTQMDDGNRITGSLRGLLQTAPNPPIPVDATAAAVGGASSYVESGTNFYTICRVM